MPSYSRSFITGSRAYGEPKPDSDIDLVVLVSDETKQLLIELSNTGNPPIRYGKLNIIAVTTHDEFKAWHKATEELIELKEKGLVLNKEQCITYIDKVFEFEGISRTEGESGA